MEEVIGWPDSEVGQIGASELVKKSRKRLDVNVEKIRHRRPR